MKKITITLFLAFAFIFTASAQNYNSVVGVRLGVPLSASYKKFINEKSAFELVAGFPKAILIILG
ncbi:MAG: hypothetical protein R2771_11970 [Saprospiraceae bacterium]